MLIIPTIGINSLTEEKISKIVLSGADILRFNFSYRIMEQTPNYVRLATGIIEELNSSVKIMIDLPTNKVRLGDFENRVYTVRESDTVTFRSSNYSPDCNEYIPVDLPRLGEKTYTNQTITIGDGEVAFQVIEIINSETIRARALNNGIIKYMKTFNIDHYISDEEFIRRCKSTWNNIESLNIDYLAVSYLNKNFNQRLIEELRLEQSHVKIIAKIERNIEQTELEELCKNDSYDMLILDLGELGVNVPFEKVGIIQKKVIKCANTYKKSVLVSTQLLDSTINNYIPNKAEILNLTNLVLEGVKGVILCHETAIGLRPSYTISVAKKIANEAEKERLRLVEYSNHYDNRQ